MRKSIIGYYDDSVGSGGTTRYLLTLLSGLNRDEFEPVLFALESRGWHKDAAALGARVVLLHESQSSAPIDNSAPIAKPSNRRITIPKKVAWTLGTAREINTLRKLFNKYPVDLLHSNNAGAEPAPIAARLSAIPLVLGTWHVDPSYDLDHVRSSWNYRLLEVASMRSLHHSIAVSNATARTWIDRCHFSEKRAKETITVVHNGIDVSLLKRSLDIPTAKAQNGWDGRLVIGSVGRLEAAKGYEYLLRALPELDCSDFVVRIAGKGELLGPLEALATELGVREQVEFLGFTANVKGFLESIDIYVQPSLCEALPMAILEASAVGMPVVASDVGGVAECVIDGETGFVVQARNSKALSTAIGKLTGDPALRTRMGARASELVNADFRNDQMVKATEDVYRRLLKANPQSTLKVS